MAVVGHADRQWLALVLIGSGLGIAVLNLFGSNTSGPQVVLAGQSLPSAEIRVAKQSINRLRDLFEGGSNSVLAHAIGKAEGTRTISGDRTRAYYGHRDPGNGKWNLGSFSWQHGADSPETADIYQLGSLKTQALRMVEIANQRGVSLSLLEVVNGLDLANQAPAAALDHEEDGFIHLLQLARNKGLRGKESICWARTYSFQKLGVWQAPGLGNNIHSIYADQERRYLAIEAVLKSRGLL